MRIRVFIFLLSCFFFIVNPAAAQDKFKVYLTSGWSIACVKYWYEGEQVLLTTSSGITFGFDRREIAKIENLEEIGVKPSEAPRPSSPPPPVTVTPAPSPPAPAPPPLSPPSPPPPAKTGVVAPAPSPKPLIPLSPPMSSPQPPPPSVDKSAAEEPKVVVDDVEEEKEEKEMEEGEEAEEKP